MNPVKSLQNSITAFNTISLNFSDNITLEQLKNKLYSSLDGQLQIKKLFSQTKLSRHEFVARVWSGPLQWLERSAGKFVWIKSDILSISRRFFFFFARIYATSVHFYPFVLPFLTRKKTNLSPRNLIIYANNSMRAHAVKFPVWLTNVSRYF